MLRESLQTPHAPPRAHRNSDALIPPLPKHKREGALTNRRDSGGFGPHPDEAAGPLQAIGNSFASLLVANKDGLGEWGG